MKTEMRIAEIKQSIADKSTEDLLTIWNEDDRNEYSDEGFEAIRQVLQNRGHNLPEKQPIERPQESLDHRQRRRKKTFRQSLGGLLLLTGILGHVIFQGSVQTGWAADPSKVDIGAIFSGLLIIGICLLVLASRIKIPSE